MFTNEEGKNRNEGRKEDANGSVKEARPVDVMREERKKLVQGMVREGWEK